MFGWDPLPRSLEAALRDACDPKTWVRVSAVRDLSRHVESRADEEAVAMLVRVLGSDPSAEVRDAAAVALADGQAHGATAALIEALDDVTIHVRQMALLALAEIGDARDPAVAPALEAAVLSEYAPVRFQALIATERLAPDRAEAALLAATEDPDVEVRHLAFRLLEERVETARAPTPPDDAAQGAPQPNRAVRRAAENALSDTSVAVRTAAAILLARMGDAAGNAALVAACSHAGRALSDEDRQAAIELCGERKLEGARRALERRAWGFFGAGGVRWAARIALARMGDARARANIMSGLSAWNRDARTFAVVAAGRARLSEARDRLLALRQNPERAEPEAVEDALEALSTDDP